MADHLPATMTASGRTPPRPPNSRSLPDDATCSFRRALCRTTAAFREPTRVAPHHPLIFRLRHLVLGGSGEAKGVGGVGGVAHKPRCVPSLGNGSSPSLCRREVARASVRSRPGRDRCRLLRASSSGQSKDGGNRLLATSTWGLGDHGGSPPDRANPRNDERRIGQMCDFITGRIAARRRPLTRPPVLPRTGFTRAGPATKLSLVRRPPRRIPMATTKVRTPCPVTPCGSQP